MAPNSDQIIAAAVPIGEIKGDKRPRDAERFHDLLKDKVEAGVHMRVVICHVRGPF